MRKEFLPVILGTDSNAYGMAKAFHLAYGIKSLVVGQGELFTTKGSKILDLKIIPDLGDDRVFAERLMTLSQSLSTEYEKLILVASSDGYVEKIINNKALLSEAYVVPFIDADLMKTLNSKKGFYETCNQHGLSYPDTRVVTPTDLEGLDGIVSDLPFSYPMVLKPSDSMRYFEANFEGKKKAYIIADAEALKNTIRAIFKSTYDQPLILQEYIAGDDTAMRVLNCVSGPDGKVRLMVLGQPLLEDPTPTLIGNYTAIIDAYDDAIFEEYKRFLEGIGYVGFSNFDMKYDAKTGKYKVFEINLRQGRSSFFVTGSGFNMAAYLVEAFIYGEHIETVYGTAPHLWLGIPTDVLMKYLEHPGLKKRAAKLINDGHTSTTLYYKKDHSLIRTIKVFRYYQRYVGTFKRYFVKKN